MQKHNTSNVTRKIVPINKNKQDKSGLGRIDPD